MKVTAFITLKRESAQTVCEYFRKTGPCNFLKVETSTSCIYVDKKIPHATYEKF